MYFCSEYVLTALEWGVLVHFNKSQDLLRDRHLEKLESLYKGLSLCLYFFCLVLETERSGRSSMRYLLRSAKFTSKLQGIMIT